MSTASHGSVSKDVLFPIERLFHPLAEPQQQDLISARLGEMPGNPLTHSQLNQLLHRSHQAGMTPGFFSFYFLSVPDDHPFHVASPPLVLDDLASIQTPEHLRWGIDRFALDAAFFFGISAMRIERLENLRMMR